MRSLVRISLTLACAAAMLPWPAAEPPATKPADGAKDYSNARSSSLYTLYFAHPAVRSLCWHDF